MSAIPYTDDRPKEILKSYNDYLHFATSSEEKRFVFIIEQDLTDPRMFIITKDSMYEDGKLEGVRLIFNDPEDFKAKFPEFFALPPVYVPTNTRRNANTGKLEGIKKDPIPIEKIEQMDENKWVIDLTEVSEVGCIWFFSPLSEITLSFYTSEDRIKFKAIPGLQNVVAEVYDKDNPTLNQKFIPYNVDSSDEPTQSIITKHILVAINNNANVNYTPEIKVRVTRAFGI